MDEWEDATVIESDSEWDNAQVIDDQDDWSSATVVEEEDPKALKEQDIINDPAKLTAVRQYMVDRKGVDWEKKTPEEVLDAFITHRRYVDTNELRTLGEARYVNSSDPQKKANVAAAYQVYDELAPFWSGGGSKVEAIKDYGLAILTSPSTWIGLGVGGIASKTATKLGAKTLAMTAARQAAKTGGLPAAKTVLAKAAFKDALLRVGTATATDVATGIGQDYMYQGIMEDVGLQEDYNYLQTAITGVLGVVGGGVASVPLIRKGSVGFDSKTIRSSIATRRAQATGKAAPRIKASVAKLVDQVNQLKSGSVDWQQAVEGGAKANPSIEDVVNNVSWFFDVEDPDSLVRIVVDSGAGLDLTEGVRFTDQIMKFVRGIPQKELDDINATIEPVLGVKLGDLLERVALGESRGGSMLNSASRAKQYAKDFAHVSALIDGVNKNAVKGLNTPAATQDAKNPEYARYLASLWRRALVSHPGTTAVNIQGWGQAYLARSLAEMLHGGLVGTAGMIGNTVGAKWSKEALRQSKIQMASQAFKLKTLFDPYATKEAFDALVKLAPASTQKRVFQEVFGGVGHETTPEMFGVGSNKLVRGAEKYVDVAGKASFVKLQDVFTKSYSGLAELDKQVRRKHNKSLTQLINDGEYYKIDEDMWNKSLQTLLQDTFSEDYTRGHRPFYLNKVASLVETASNTPYIGFLMPFGRFMNNNMAFQMQYSILAAFPVAARMAKTVKKEGVQGLVADTELGTDLAKTMVGSMALATLIHQSGLMRDEGFQWFEVEESGGDVTTEQNMAPIAGFRLAARIGDSIVKGESIPKDLWTEAVNQLGIWQWAKEAGGENPLTNFVAYLEREDNPEALASAWGLVASSLASLGSGFTRPLDPINQLTGMITETDAAIDRRQADPGMDAAINEITRYTDNLFDALLYGEEQNESGVVGDVKHSATRPEGAIHNPNPVAGLVGRKEVPAKNYIDKLLGMTDMPAYLVDQRSGIPEADDFMNQQVAPLLNSMSKKLLDTESFKSASPAIKRTMTKEMIAQARKIVRGWLGDSVIGTYEDKVEDMRRIWLTRPQALRDEARIKFGIKTPDRDLSEGEITVMRNYIGLLEGMHDAAIGP